MLRFIDSGRDAPADRGGVEHQGQALVHRFAVGEQVVEGGLADDRAQRGLRDLRDRVLVVLHLDDRLHRVHDAVVDHRVDTDGHVVPGDAVLGRYRHGDDLRVDPDQAVRERAQRGDAGLSRLAQDLAPAVHHAAFELAHHAEPGPADQAEYHQGTENDLKS
jgi:hypothetical protein